jgi:hypothetical protein
MTDISRWTKANPQWGIQNVFKSPRPYLLPWKKTFWTQFERRKLLAQQLNDWIH